MDKCEACHKKSVGYVISYKEWSCKCGQQLLDEGEIGLCHPKCSKLGWHFIDYFAKSDEKVIVMYSDTVICGNCGLENVNIMMVSGYRIKRGILQRLFG